MENKIDFGQVLRFNHLMNSFAYSSISYLIAIIAFSFYAHYELLDSRPLWWAGGITFTIVLRSLIYFSYKSNIKQDTEVLEWLFAICSGMSGLVWATAFYIFTDDLSLYTCASLVVLTCGVSIGASTSYSSSLKTNILFQIGIIVPMSIQLFFMSSNFELIGFLSVVLLALVLKVSRQNYLLMKKHIDQTFEKDKLIEAFKMTQEKYIHTSRMAALGEMGQSLAHEINNPLQIITSLAHKIEKKYDYSFDNDELKRIQHSAERINKIINALKKLSAEGTSGDFNMTEIPSVMEDFISLVMKKTKVEGIDLDVNIETEAIFWGNGIEISQVLINLFNNSFDEIKSQENPWIKIHVFEENDHVIVDFIDSGKIQDEFKKDNMFRAFYSTKDNEMNSGLGLSISYEILASHNGKLEYLGDKENTTFRISLPIFESTSIKKAS